MSPALDFPEETPAIEPEPEESDSQSDDDDDSADESVSDPPADIGSGPVVDAAPVDAGTPSASTDAGGYAGDSSASPLAALPPQLSAALTGILGALPRPAACMKDGDCTQSCAPISEKTCCRSDKVCGCMVPLLETCL